MSGVLYKVPTFDSNETADKQRNSSTSLLKVFFVLETIFKAA